MAGEVEKRVLKLGLVQDGKIIEESILGEKEGVTIGTDPRNTITITDKNLPKRHRLIEPSGNQYKLTLFDKLDGKISLGDKVFSLSDKQTEAVAVRKGHWREIKLPTSSKGKLVIGKTTILFQLVPPPPTPPILKLPKELRANLWNGLDVFFVVVLLLSALFHVSLVTYMNTIEISDSLTNAEIQKFTKQLISTADVQLIEDQANDKEDEELGKKPKKAGGGGPKDGALEDKGVETKGLLALITKYSDAGGSVADIISEGIGDDLTAAISGISGVDVARKGSEGGLKGTKGDGGSGSGGTVGVGNLGSVSSQGSVSSGKRVETKVKSKIGGSGGGITGKIDSGSVYGVIRGRLGGVRYCYESQLKTNPSLAGKIRVQFVIGVSGGVSSCSVVSNSMGNALVQECVCRVVRRFKFPPPEDGSATVAYTFIFSSAQ